MRLRQAGHPGITTPLPPIRDRWWFVHEGMRGARDRDAVERAVAGSDRAKPVRYFAELKASNGETNQCLQDFARFSFNYVEVGCETHEWLEQAIFRDSGKVRLTHIFDGGGCYVRAGRAGDFPRNRKHCIGK
jgi:hypothetical protein